MPRKQKYATAEELEKAKPMTEWTTRELRMWIRETTKGLNEYTEKTPDDAIDPRIEVMIHRAQEAAQGRRDEDLHLGLNLTYKRKDELMLQARRLKETRDYNLFLDDDIRNARTEQARKAFNRNYSTNLTEKEYGELVDVFGASDDYFKAFSYEDFVSATIDAVKKGLNAPTVVRMASEILRDIKTSDTILTTADAIDELYRRIDSIEIDKDFS